MKYELSERNDIIEHSGDGKSDITDSQRIDQDLSSIPQQFPIPRQRFCRRLIPIGLGMTRSPRVGLGPVFTWVLLLHYISPFFLRFSMAYMCSLISGVPTESKKDDP